MKYQRKYRKYIAKILKHPLYSFSLSFLENYLLYYYLKASGIYDISYEEYPLFRFLTSLVVLWGVNDILFKKLAKKIYRTKRIPKKVII